MHKTTIERIKIGLVYFMLSYSYLRQSINSLISYILVWEKMFGNFPRFASVQVSKIKVILYHINLRFSISLIKH
jgi:hypothetical protein